MTRQSSQHNPDPSGESEPHVLCSSSHETGLEAHANPSAVPWPDYLTVKEAARLLGVSERSVYGYRENHRLPFTRQGTLLVIETAAVRGVQRQATGRPRVRHPEWHRSSSENGQVLTRVSVRVRAGQRQALEHRLEEISVSNRHLLPGTIARSMAWEPTTPQRVSLVFIWRKGAMPSEEERIASLAALWEDLDDLRDWESVDRQEGEIVLHT